MRAVEEERIVPWEAGRFLPDSTRLEMGMRTLSYGALAIVGLLMNLVSVGVIVKGKLYKNWTYVMLMNLCLADILLCVTYIIFFLPPVVMAR